MTKRDDVPDTNDIEARSERIAAHVFAEPHDTVADIIKAELSDAVADAYKAGRRDAIRQIVNSLGKRIVSELIEEGLEEGL